MKHDFLRVHFKKRSHIKKVMTSLLIEYILKETVHSLNTSKIYKDHKENCIKTPQSGIH